MEKDLIKNNRNIAIWLFISAASVFLMALIGAITRLTESGLSIVEWNPISGILPPLNHEAWLSEFNLYKISPQFIDINSAMSLAEFKNIFFWEWFHRLWGRTLGMIYFIPLVYFWIRNKIPEDKKRYLIIILLLGFAQGFMGWLMVASGLVDRPSVSHYRLAAHLILAAILFCEMFRMGLVFAYRPQENNQNIVKMKKFIFAVFLLLTTTIIWGAFTAGLDAGLLYNNDFPFMGEHLWPDELSPIWSNFFENRAVVQFTHRCLALTSIISISLLVVTGLNLKPAPRLKKLFIAILVAVFIQVSLGISVIITTVNISLATMHQGGALIILMLLIAIFHEL